MTARSLLPLYSGRPDREGRDRLEVLTALINGPSFDPVFRPEVIQIPSGHPFYQWQCVVDRCERTRSGGTDVCQAHMQERKAARERGVSRAQFLTAATPARQHAWAGQARCRICPDRPAMQTVLLLCRRHGSQWSYQLRAHGPDVAFDAWAADQQPLPGYGVCQVAVCPALAASPLRLCSGHETRYERLGRPGRASLPARWIRLESSGLPVHVGFDDQPVFAAWCAAQTPITVPGQLNLAGLRPLLRAEIAYVLFAHAQDRRAARWSLDWLQKLVNLARERGAGSLTDIDLTDFPRFHASIVRTMLHHLRLVYFTPEDSREAGFIETDHFGIRFANRGSHIDLTAISQRWLRDLFWDHLAAILRSPQCPRSGMPVDTARRAVTELSAFLLLDADGGDDPRALTQSHAQRFVADQQHRQRHGLASLAMKGSDGQPSIVTELTRSLVANGVRRLLREAMDSGRADELGLAREFITAMPFAGGAPLRARRPFDDQAARALADEANLADLAAIHDPTDHGLRDIWEAIVLTGRRANEILRLRLECVGRYGGMPVLWHDQTKVGNYDAAIRIPERLHDILTERRSKTIEAYTSRYGVRPDAATRAGLALFPALQRNPDGTVSICYHWFLRRFRTWVDGLDLGQHVVPHQARHSVATNLLRHGATLTHIRRYLGQVSDRMAEHYVHLTQSDLDDVLQHVWVAGPGSANPGQLLAGDAPNALTREQAMSLALDLNRRSTPAEGGFCTFQPVVDGGACPWDMNCHSCDKFVLSGADLLYWQRKREQWRLLAEGAPDDATADYLHAYFEPTARAIDGLEKALAGLGLLADALALDLRKPQDYFHRIWSTAFRATDLAAVDEDAGNDAQDTDDEEAA